MIVLYIMYDVQTFTFWQQIICVLLYLSMFVYAHTHGTYYTSTLSVFKCFNVDT